jgi:antitoxin component YwqK of YwqJK toxin-antitoxin module
MTNSKNQGEIISYGKDGKLVRVEWYTNGNLDCELDISEGKHSYYHDDDETILWQKYTIKNGKPTGEWVIHHGNGQMQEYRKYKNGVRLGTWNGWHPDGNLWWEEIYENGEKNGKCKRWRYDDVLEYEGRYKNGKRNGLWVTYYDNGTREYLRIYKDGKLNGNQSRCHKSNGKLWTTSEYKNGKRSGKYFEYESGLEKIVILDRKMINVMVSGKDILKMVQSGLNQNIKTENKLVILPTGK